LETREKFHSEVITIDRMSDIFTLLSLGILISILALMLELISFFVILITIYFNFIKLSQNRYFIKKFLLLKTKVCTFVSDNKNLNEI